MAERDFKTRFFRKLNRRLPGGLLIRTDPSTQQGITDHLFLYGPRWAALEFKDSRSSKKQPNQEYFVKRLSEMGFGAFVYPENEKEVLDALEQALKPPRRTRISES